MFAGPPFFDRAEPIGPASTERHDVTASPLHLQSVSKRYGSHLALDDVSFTLEAGQFNVLLGLNGAGKTTLFQLLTALFTPDHGEIVIDGLDLRRQAVRALARLGVVFQQSTLDLDLSVRQNLRFHARLHGMGPHTKPRIEEELARVGLSEQADVTVRKLSGGNRRKVELARALLNRPRLLLMDEPTVGLDPGSRRALLAYVHQLCAEQGTAVLWATHLVDEAEGAARVFILHHGQLIAEESPQGLCQQTGEETLADAFLRLTGRQEDLEEDL